MDTTDLLTVAGGPVTRSRISHDLAELGLGGGDVAMFYTRMSAVGYVAGGAQTIIDALRDVVGTSGTLRVTCGWNDAPPYDASVALTGGNVNDCIQFTTMMAGVRFERPGRSG